MWGGRGGFSGLNQHRKRNKHAQSLSFFCYETVAAARLFDGVNSGVKVGVRGEGMYFCESNRSTSGISDKQQLS